MKRRHLVLGAATVLGAAGLASWYGRRSMGWFDSTRRDLQQLLGDSGAVWLDDSARLAAWSPDPNYKPQAYYLLRPMDEAAFRRAADLGGLAVVLAPPVEQAVWRLPAGVKLPGWQADSLPPGTGLQALGTLGSVAVAARWHQGHAYLVATVTGT